MRHDNKKKEREFRGSLTVAKEGEPIAVTLRRFKKKVEESGLLDTLRAKEFYEKPTTARKRAKGAAKARWRKKLRDKELPKKMY